MGLRIIFLWILLPLECIMASQNVYWDLLPSFGNSSKREFVTNIGQTAFLHCTVTNLGDRVVSWIRKRDLHILTVGILTYTNDQRFQSIHLEGSDDWMLKVTSPQPSDSGVYECQISTEPKMSRGFQLKVVVSKAIILGSVELHVRFGSDINLTCFITHTLDPPSFIYWYKEGSLINYSNRGGINVVTEKHTRSSKLVISKAVPEDSGNYTCLPSIGTPASVFVHVLLAEEPAAMQHGAANRIGTIPLRLNNILLWLNSILINCLLQLALIYYYFIK